MARKPASLSLHRNTLLSRKQKLMREGLIGDAKSIAQEGVVAYAIVTINQEGKAFASWDSGGVMPLHALAGFVRNSLECDIGNSGIADDWVPSLEQFRGPKR